MHRKLLLFFTGALLVLMFMTGCSDEKTGTISPPPATPSDISGADTAPPSAGTSNSAAPSDDTQKPVLDKLGALLKAPGNEKAVIAEIRQDISKLSPENADQMILAFEAYQKEAIDGGSVLSSALTDLIRTAADEPYNEEALNDLSKITNADLKAELQDVFDKGYKIIVPEGMHEAVIDYGIYKDAAAYVSPDITAYIDIMAKESDSRMSTDAAIIIPVDGVLKRAEASEAFIKNYPDSVIFDAIAQKYMIYVDAYFFGQDNTPAFDYTTKKLDQKFLDSYQKAASGSGDSAAAKAAAEYLNILKENGYTLTKVVADYRKNMTDELKAAAS